MGTFIRYIYNNERATAAQTATLYPTNGNITRVLLTVSTNTGNKGATLTLDDVDSFEIFNSGLKAKGASYVMDVDIPIKGAVTLGMTPEGDPGASGQTVVVKIMGE